MILIWSQSLSEQGSFQRINWMMNVLFNCRNPFQNRVRFREQLNSPMQQKMLRRNPFQNRVRFRALGMA